MHKAQLIESMATKSGLTKADSEKALAAFIDSVQETVKTGEKVTITGFGGFEKRERSARKGRNPQTGEEMDIAASVTVAFKAGKGFKDFVAN